MGLAYRKLPKQQYQPSNNPLLSSLFFLSSKWCSTVIKQQAQKTSLFGLLTCFVVGSIVGSIVGSTQSARAEGSYELIKDYISTADHRPYTENRLNTTGGLARQTIPQVFAKPGEVIHLGSSAINLGTGGNVKLYAPGDDPATTTPVLDCRASQFGKGLLTTPAQESFGPKVTALDAGYDSCKYTVPSTGGGIYTVIMTGPSGVGTTQSGTAITASAPVLTDQATGLALWDVTVRTSATAVTNLKGRVFVDKLALYMVSNNRYLRSELFILTDGGYRYSTDLSPTTSQGLDPNGFIFIANDRGVLTPSGQSLYRSGSGGGDNTVTPPLIGGVTVQGPQHKIFFNTPDEEVVTALGYPSAPILPIPATNFKFEGQVNNLTLTGIGGNFKFDSATDDGFQIAIDANNDGAFTASGGDRIIDGTAVIGLNTVFWDGKNNSGANVPPLANNAAYPARIIMKGGEYHFPLLDAENNNEGFTIKMLNPPGAFPVGSNQYTVFYDERDYALGSTPVSLGCPTSGTNPPCDARGGLDSNAAPRKYASGYGDKKAVDTWAYFPSAAVTADVIIQALAPTVSGTKSVKISLDTDGSGGPSTGDTVEYLITYKNTGGGPADTFILQDDLPASLQFVSALIASQTNATLALNPSYAGTGNLINATTLPANSTIAIKLTAKILTAGTTINNQAIATYKPTATTTTTVLSDADAPTGAIAQVTDDGVNTGNDPTKNGDDDPTLLTVSPPPRVRLVKRITKIATTSLNNHVDFVLAADPTAPDDNAPNWPALTAIASQSPTVGATPNFSSLLQGAISPESLPAGTELPRPNEEIEYTIYFLSDGGVDAKNLKICDFIPANNTYVPNSLVFSQGGSTPIAPPAPGFYIDNSPELSTTTGPCKNGINNGRGGVIVDLGTIPRATASGIPATSYGFIRFRATVK
ncbi:MAG: DUF11 domain-containing protein [Alkalinema sp. RU_4_3]|nr:DUF11 domain-containing protein [Alkalinema sp. RU_4_3]